MIDIKGIGSEGVILIAAFLILKDILIPFWKKVLIPRWAKLTGKNPHNTLRMLDATSVSLAEVITALKKHEEMDKDRTNEIKDDVKDLKSDCREFEARIRVLESSRAP